MPDISGVFKSEITRLSRKTAREFLKPLHASTASHRSQLAALKKKIEQLQREVATLKRAAEKQKSAEPESADDTRVRFVAKGLRSLRERLGLSAEDFGRLVGVSGQSIYHWESGKTTPRKTQVIALSQLRGIGKREAKARLDAGAAESGD